MPYHRCDTRARCVSPDPCVHWAPHVNLHVVNQCWAASCFFGSVIIQITPRKLELFCKVGPDRPTLMVTAWASRCIAYTAAACSGCLQLDRGTQTCITTMLQCAAVACLKNQLCGFRRLLASLQGNQGSAYRRMKTVSEMAWKHQESHDLRWENFTPGTNVAWIEYLCEEVLTIVFVRGKSGRSGKLRRASMSKEEKQSWRDFRHAVRAMTHTQVASSATVANTLIASSCRKACRSPTFSESCKDLLMHPFFSSVRVE